MLRRSRQSVFKSSPLDNEDALGGRWTFEGAVIDVSGNQNNGTLTGSPSFADTTFGGAIRLNGTSQYVDVGASATVNPAGALTYAAWINRAGAGGTDGQAIFGGDANGLTLRIGSFDSKLNFLKTNVVNMGQSTGTITTGRDTHVAVTWNNPAISFYIDGALSGTASSATGGITFTTLRIGAAFPGGNIDYFNGTIADARVYTRALTEAEINALYNQGLSSRFSLSPDEWEMPILATLVKLRTDVDSIDGNWTNELGGTSLFDSIDETVASDTDYIISGVNPNLDIAKISLSNPSTHVAGPVVVRYRYKKSATPAADLSVRLLQGSTEIAAWTHTGISASYVTSEQTLTAPQLASISDFNDLYIEFTADS